MHYIKLVDHQIVIELGYITRKQLQDLLKDYLPEVGEILGKTSEQLQTEWCKYFQVVSFTELNQTQADTIINRCKSVIFTNQIKTTT